MLTVFAGDQAAISADGKQSYVIHTAESARVVAWHAARVNPISKKRGGNKDRHACKAAYTNYNQFHGG